MCRLGSLFASFFGVGALTLGGGYAMLPLIEREVVRRRGWVGEGEFLDVLALAQALPGPVAFNTAVFVGYRQRGVVGAGAAALGVVAPSFLAMLAIVTLLIGWRDHPAVARVFNGLRPAVVALIVATLPGLAKKAKLGPGGGIVAAGVAAVLLQPWVAVSPAWIVLAALVAGAVRAARPGADPEPPSPLDAAPDGDATAADRTSSPVPRCPPTDPPSD